MRTAALILTRQIRAAARPSIRALPTAQCLLPARCFATSLKARISSPDLSVKEEAFVPEESEAAQGIDMPQEDAIDAEKAFAAHLGNSDAQETFKHLIGAAKTSDVKNLKLEELDDSQLSHLAIVTSAVYPGSVWHLPPADLAVPKVKFLERRREDLPSEAYTSYYVYKTYQFETTESAGFFYTGVGNKMKFNFGRAAFVLYYDSNTMSVTIGLPTQHGLGVDLSSAEATENVQAMHDILRVFRAEETAEEEKAEAGSKLRSSFCEYGFTSLYNAVVKGLDMVATNAQFMDTRQTYKPPREEQRNNRPRDDQRNNRPRGDQRNNRPRDEQRNDRQRRPRRDSPADE